MRKLAGSGNGVDQFVWHPFTPMHAYRDENAPIIAEADGFFLIDIEGRRYLDGFSSLWCNVHGHRVPEIDGAVREQLDHVAHTTLLGLSTCRRSSWPENSSHSALGLSKVFYSDSGATSRRSRAQDRLPVPRAVDASLRGRNPFLCIGGAYHGDTIGTVSVGGIPLFHGVYRDLLFETVTVPSPVTGRRRGVLHIGLSRLLFSELERLIVEDRDRAAGFIIEPLVQGAAGMLVHPTGYSARIRMLTREHGVPLIADEVAVGFGRTGTMFACEQEDVFPICCAWPKDSPAVICRWQRRSRPMD